MRSTPGIIAAIVVFLAVSAPADEPATPAIYFQAHRGGLEEVPENTLPALRYAWTIPGAVPEVDVQTTQDGQFVILHDDTPQRTTDAPPEWAERNIRDIPFATLRAWDAGRRFDARYAGAKVPSLEEVLDLLKAQPDRQLYLDLKAVDNGRIIALLKDRGVTGQVLFVHGSPAECEKLSQAWPGARTMTWLSGNPERIKTRFRELATTGFKGISQIQLHLKPKEGAGPGVYELDPEFLREAQDAATAAGVALQIRPFVFDPPAMRQLIDLGVRWFVADAPKALRDAIDAALAL